MKLKNIILALIEEMGGEIEGRSKLMKLLFLIDHASAKELGRPATNYGWTYHFFGPYSMEAMKDLHELVRAGKLAEGYNYSSDTFIYRLLDHGFHTDPNVRHIIRQVASKYGNMKVEDIIKECNAILSDIGAEPGERITLQNAARR